MIASISYPPIPLFEFGPLRLSVHGLFAGIAFVVGAWVLLRETSRRGFDEDKMLSVLIWCLVGGLIGSYVFTIPAHLEDGIVNALRPFRTLSIMGAFAGGFIGGIWRGRTLGMHVMGHIDVAALGLPIATMIGRVGDLLIVEHLGARTDFFLGYLLKPGYDVAPQHDALEGLCGGLGECGPYHHAALYDFLGAFVLLGVMYVVTRRWSGVRYGVPVLLWGAWYGFQRFLIDFTRNTDRLYADATAGPFTWSQWVGLGLGVACTAAVVWIMVGRKTPVITEEQDAAYAAAAAGE